MVAPSQAPRSPPEQSQRSKMRLLGGVCGRLDGREQPAQCRRLVEGLEAKRARSAGSAPTGSTYQKTKMQAIRRRCANPRAETSPTSARPQGLQETQALRSQHHVARGRRGEERRHDVEQAQGRDPEEPHEHGGGRRAALGLRPRLRFWG